MAASTFFTSRRNAGEAAVAEAGMFKGLAG